MTPEQFQQVGQLYSAALEREPNERAAFLAEACAGDADLRREVEELLRYDDEPGSLLQGNALEVAAQALAGDPAPRAFGQNLGRRL